MNSRFFSYDLKLCPLRSESLKRPLPKVVACMVDMKMSWMNLKGGLWRSSSFIFGFVMLCFLKRSEYIFWVVRTILSFFNFSVFSSSHFLRLVCTDVSISQSASISPRCLSISTLIAISALMLIFFSLSATPSFRFFSAKFSS